SLYRVRDADPTLTLDKYKGYAHSPELGKKIDVEKNFRNREDVLTSTNYGLSQSLDEAVEEISNDSASALVYANKSYNEAPLQNDKTELILIDRDKEGNEEDEEKVELEKAQTEGRAYAKKIKEWLGTKDTPPLQVIDSETKQQRDIQY